MGYINTRATGVFPTYNKAKYYAEALLQHTHTHLVSGDRDPSEDAPWYTLWDSLLSGLSSLSYAIILHSWRLFLAFLTFFTSRVVPSIRFCSWCPGRESKHAKTEGKGKEQVKCSCNARETSLVCRQETFPFQIMLTLRKFERSIYSLTWHRPSRSNWHLTI